MKGANSVKVFGPDLATLEKLSARIQAEMAKVRGITDLGVSDSLGQPTVRIDVDRAAAARYGLTPDDINTTVAAAIGGQSPGDLYETGTDRHFPIVVRLRPNERDSLESIRRITIGAPAANGNGIVQVPLSEVAKVRLTSGASFVYREHQERYIPIKFSVRDRDLGGAVGEAQAASPGRAAARGYHLEWAGELGNLTSAVSTAGGGRADQPGTDPDPALRQFLLGHRHADGVQRHPDGDRRRRAGAGADRHPVQHLRRDRLRRAVRHRGDGRHPDGDDLQPGAGRRHGAGGGARHHRRHGAPPGGDDLRRRRDRPAARRRPRPASAARCRSPWRWSWSAAWRSPPC